MPETTAALTVASAADAGVKRGNGMWSWTDWRDPASIAASAALTTIVDEHVVAGRRVLFAGPHDADLVRSAQAAGAVVSWLIRSVDDAGRLTHDLPGVDVLCGSLEDPAGPFDLVIALDGFGRLTSAEDDDTGRDLVALLSSLVAADGVLVLLHENALGAHRMIELAPGREYTADEAWYLPEAYEPRLPASFGALTAALGDHGLQTHAGYAVFPTPKRPHVLVGRPVLDDPASGVRDGLRPLLTHAFAEAYRGREVLDDPRDLVTRMAYAAAEQTLAAGWLVIAGRGDTTAKQYELVVGSEAGQLVSTIDSGVSEVHGEPRTVGGLREMTPVRLPSGPTVEERLLRLCAAADLPGLRAELRRYADWLRNHGSELTGPVALATFATVCDDGDELRPDLVRWEPLTPVPLKVALHRALWSFAGILITRNRPHPYPLTFDAAELTEVLAATVDAVPGPGDLDAVLDLEIAVRTAHGDPDPVRTRRELSADLRPMPDVAGYRALVDVLWRQNDLLQHARENAAWLEKILVSRDTALSKLDLQIQQHELSGPEQVVELARKAYKKVRGKVAARRQTIEQQPKPKLCSSCRTEELAAGTPYRRLRVRVERIDFDAAPPRPRDAVATGEERAEGAIVVAE
ncbi:MAG: hypothetical protein HOV77_25235 [Hamadaea sp.]|uniref:hypothetical protein n=1 Tax=Hamadaea sp. TaxID=2024425 RepID=UPI001841662E|nr:hypothetical protein [Hamadaea sp.]NUT22490.1 hypothetical protein [Hamadaea sp.]